MSATGSFRIKYRRTVSFCRPHSPHTSAPTITVPGIKTGLLQFDRNPFHEVYDRKNFEKRLVNEEKKIDGPKEGPSGPFVFHCNAFFLLLVVYFVQDCANNEVLSFGTVRIQTAIYPIVRSQPGIYGLGRVAPVKTGTNPYYYYSLILTGLVHEHVLCASSVRRILRASKV